MYICMLPCSFWAFPPKIKQQCKSSPTLNPCLTQSSLPCHLFPSPYISFLLLIHKTVMQTIPFHEAEVIDQSGRVNRWLAHLKVRPGEVVDIVDAHLVTDGKPSHCHLVTLRRWVLAGHDECVTLRKKLSTVQRVYRRRRKTKSLEEQENEEKENKRYGEAEGRAGKGLERAGGKLKVWRNRQRRGKTKSLKEQKEEEENKRFWGTEGREGEG